MSFLHAHFDRCRREDHVRSATIGVGTYTVLMLAVVAYAAVLTYWP